jgi:hypothetical protein
VNWADPQVQIALVAAGAAILGAALGSTVGALGAWVVARANRDEAREARFADRVRMLAAQIIETAVGNYALATTHRHERVRVPDWRGPFLELKLIVRQAGTYAAVVRFEDANADLWGSVVGSRVHDQLGLEDTPAGVKREQDEWSDLMVEWDAAQLAFEDAMRAELGGSPAKLEDRRIRHN